MKCCEGVKNIFPNGNNFPPIVLCCEVQALGLLMDGDLFDLQVTQDEFRGWSALYETLKLPNEIHFHITLLEISLDIS